MPSPAPSTEPPPDLAGRLQTVFHECLAAMECLRRCEGEPAKHVHTMRRRGKRLRAGLLLVQAPRPVIDELRDMGRILGAARDAAVREQTLHALREQAGEDFRQDTPLEVVVALLADEASLAGGTPAAAVLDFVDERLAAVGAWLDGLDTSQASPPPTAVLRRFRERTGKTLARATRKKASSRHFHVARKAVKRLQGALWFLRSATEPQADSPELRHWENLAEDLGGINDLDVLATWLDHAGLTAVRLPGLHRAMRRRRQRLIARVGRHAKRAARPADKE